jgi:hypothetical protein
MLRATAWLAAALHVMAGLFWALVSTPESNVAMLALSLLLVVALVLTAGIALDVAMRVWHGGPALPARALDVLWPGLRLLPALALFVVVWSAAHAAGAQVEASRGRITAAIIARSGWANPEVLFTAARWLVALASWVIAPLLALGLFGALSRGAVANSTAWLRQALSWRAVGTGALAMAALAVGWPWLDAWRPALPPTWIQLVFVAAKGAAGLTAVALVLAAFVRLAALDRRKPATPS